MDKEVWYMENGTVVDTWTWDTHGWESEKPRGSKKDWGQGEWTDEPDKLSWTDPATKLPCLIVRGPAGSLCGYVGVDETHPYFGRPYSTWSDTEFPGPDVSVHGGLTFAEACSPGEDEATGICHVSQPGAAEHVWWFGFDCAHYGDFSPGMQYSLEQSFIRKGEPIADFAKRHTFETYKGVPYVMGECQDLAGQLANLKMPELTTGS